MILYRSEKGLTLLEVLVAIVILSIILGVIYSSFLGTTRTASILESSEDAYQTAQAFFDMLSRELRGTYYRKGRTPAGLLGIASESRENPTDAVYFLTTSLGRRTPKSTDGTLAEVGYFFDVDELSNTRHLIKSIDMTPDMDLRKGGKFYPLTDRVKSLKFSYFQARENKWFDQWKKPDLPDLIRVELTVLDDQDHPIYFRTTLQPMLRRGKKIRGNPVP
ncbi:MAG: prepilin-type N-terminal cleavage/methylation domain-containing protein [Deltaproteobacteria bacterium]|nr:prepilin-type N-terminal cleavage/methylation domain-containing protein [Deltaproteobacteria bacterium]